MGMSAAHCQGIVREMSGNFRVSGEWSPCTVQRKQCPVWGGGCGDTQRAAGICLRINTDCSAASHADRPALTAARRLSVRLSVLAVKC